MKHCPHSTGIVLNSYPPQYPEYCCHCGARRTRMGRFAPLLGHGSFLDPSTHAIEIIDPWDDTCHGPSSKETGRAESSHES